MTHYQGNTCLMLQVKRIKGGKQQMRDNELMEGFHNFYCFQTKKICQEKHDVKVLIYKKP